jgi:hypothetical protein
LLLSSGCSGVQSLCSCSTPCACCQFLNFVSNSVAIPFDCGCKGKDFFRVVQNLFESFFKLFFITLIYKMLQGHEKAKFFTFFAAKSHLQRFLCAQNTRRRQIF